MNGVAEFSSSESMADHHKKVTGSVTKQQDPEKLTIPGEGREVNFGFYSLLSSLPSFEWNKIG